MNRIRAPFLHNHAKPCLSDWNELEGKLRLAESCLKTRSRWGQARELLEAFFSSGFAPAHMRERIAVAWKNSDRQVRLMRVTQREVPRTIPHPHEPTVLDFEDLLVSTSGEPVWYLADLPIPSSEKVAGYRPSHDINGPIRYCSDDPKDIGYRLRALIIVDRDD